jgi:hypothetical protein
MQSPFRFAATAGELNGHIACLDRMRYDFAFACASM